MRTRLANIREDRLEKLNKLKSMGINPYPSLVEGKITPISNTLESMGKSLGVAGRVMGVRSHGSVCFVDLKDESGEIQLWFQKNNLGDKFEPVSLIDMGDFLYAQGEVLKTKAGETSVDVVKYQILSKSLRSLPSTWHGLKDVEERYRKRYLDLILNPEVKKVFEVRTKIIKLLREKLDNKGFVEVATPALQPLYGGATARPFRTHHNALDSDFYLRIADELYLKRLIVGGFEKVYEICTDFRNEGIDRWHNPEFTQLEFYWAYANYQDLMVLTEEMLSEIVKEIKGSFEFEYAGVKLDFKPPWERLIFRDAILKFTDIDIDKFDSLKKLLEEVDKKGIKLDKNDTHDFPSVYDSLYKKEVRSKIVNPTFIIDHPYIMRPLAKRKADNPQRVESLQPVAAGTELLNAYSELNDPQDQRARWEEDADRAKKGAEEFQPIDEDYIKALEYGMPPTAGWGMGIDRFTALLTNQHSLKDVILFPTLRPEKSQK